MQSAWSSVVWRSLTAIDLKLSRKLAFCAEPNALRPVMKLLEFSAHGVPWIVGTFIVLLLQETSQEIEIILNLLFALLVDLLVIGVLKGVFRRKRPHYNQEDMFLTVSLDNYSFPSGHATRSAMLAVYLLTHFRFRAALKLLTVLWSLCVSFSRVVLGRHHLFDVIAGLFVGVMQYYYIVDKLWIQWPYYPLANLLNF